MDLQGTKSTDGAIPDDASRCPCSSGDVFGSCCAPLLRGAVAPTAERLMRSRYTAFILRDAAYLLRSWHPHTRPAEMEFDHERQWRRLVIVDRSAGGPFDREGIVEFEAHWREANTRGAQYERSRFVREGRHWLYVDGDVST